MKELFRLRIDKYDNRMAIIQALQDEGYTTKIIMIESDSYKDTDKYYIIILDLNK